MRKILIAGCACILLLVACSSDKKSATTTTVPTTAARETTTTTKAKTGPLFADLPKVGQPLTEQQFSDALTAGAGQRFRVAEKRTTKTGTAVIKSDVTMSNDPPRRSGVTTMASIFIVAPNEGVACERKTGSWVCAPASLQEADLFESIKHSNAKGATNIRRLPDQTIINRPAICIAFDKTSESDGQRESITICLDKKTGAPMKLKTRKPSGIESETVATSITLPTDADFTPPAPVTR